MPWPSARRLWTIAAYAMLGLVVVAGAWSVWWGSRYAVAVHRLTRGIGDTVFLSSDGKPWFRLDDQRHDVALDAIAPDLQHAIVAIEDRRFFYHPGISPWSNYEGALDRSHVVLAQMREQGFITAEQEQAARRVRPRIQTFRQAREGASGWAKDYLRQQFRDEFGGDHPPDWTVRTSFDRSVQDAVEKAIAAGLARIGRPRRPQPPARTRNLVVLALFHLPQRATGASVRCCGRRDGRADNPVHPAHRDLFRRGWRRRVFVERAGVGLRHMPFGDALDDKRLLAAEGAADRELIAGLEHAVRLRGLPVDGDLAVLHGLLGFGPRPEQARDIEPHVEPCTRL